MKSIYNKIKKMILKVLNQTYDGRQDFKKY